MSTHVEGVGEGLVVSRSRGQVWSRPPLIFLCFVYCIWFVCLCVRPSIRSSVRPSVRPFVRSFVRLFVCSFVHRSLCLQVPRDPSASVPMVIYDGRATSEAAKERTVFKEDAPQAPKYGSPGSIVWQPTQLIDIFPTVMEYANVPRSGWPSGLDGTSLLPFLPPTPSSSSPETISGHVTTVPAVHSHPGGRDAWVTSQFHGCNIAMSWFMIVQQGPDGHAYKYIVWGTGEEVPPQLFDLTKDPSEFTDLLANETSAPKEIKQLVATLDKNLRSTIDYPSVAMQVATYNKDSFTAWVNNTQNWEAAIHASGLRWDKSWDLNPGGAIAAVKQWMAAPAQVLPCRQALVWPPPTSQE